MPKAPISDVHPLILEQPTEGFERLPGVGTFVDFAVGLHEAERAGKHYDIRLGTPDIGLLSWATKKEIPDKPGESVQLFPQPIHSWDYLNFSGEIPKGYYGAGVVHPAEVNRALVIDFAPQGIAFSLNTKQGLRRFRIQKTGNGRWYLINVTPRKELPEKVHYKLLSEEQARKLLQEIGRSISSVQPKIDGALGIITIGKNGIDIFSPRISAKSGLPIPYTEKIFGYRPKINAPQNLYGSILLGEVYAVRKTPDGKEVVLKPNELTAILNSNLETALKKVRENNIEFRVWVFDAVKLGREDGYRPDWYLRDYDHRRNFINSVVQYLPSVFHAPIEATDQQSAEQLLNEIKKRRHALTEEGVVLFPRSGVPYKYKTMKEEDFYIVGYTPGSGKYKDRGVGAILISDKPGGEPIGAVGSGLTDELREMFYQHPEMFLNRKVRVKFLERFPSGTLRKPVFIALHEG
ncbi:MAG: hypothetical protein KatS3mg087_0011 [Patescibacteria group bacterium]|nr:MAG: hypothetical protein KatS3mg087_0011 [Patescibacteria group bacterium]